MKTTIKFSCPEAMDTVLCLSRLWYTATRIKVDNGIQERFLGIKHLKI